MSDEKSAQQKRQDQQRKLYEDMQRAANQQRAQAHEAMAMERFNLIRAQNQARENQNMINNRKRQQYAAIVAVDLRGAFSRNGEIPWNYPDDFKWFQEVTNGHICVMGRATYDDINKRLGKKGATSVLPGRRCFVVTSSPLPRDNATAVSSIGQVDKYLTPEDADNGLTVFFIGGEKIYREGIAKADTLYITVVNKEVEGDKFFPTNYTLKHFNVQRVLEKETTPDIRFTVWSRKNG